VPEADIQQATAVTTMTNNVAEFAGPALATVLVLGAGAGWAFALDAVTFLVSAAFLVRVTPRARTLSAPAVAARTAAAGGSADATNEPPDAAQQGVWEGIRAGAREVRSRVWVWATLASFCVALFCGLAPWFVLGPIVAREQYGHVAVYGFVEAALGFGTILGSLAGVIWRPRFPLRQAMLAIMLWPLAAILYATGLTLALVIPATIVAGAGIALFDVWWLTALAERIPPGALSRVSSFDWMLSCALLPLGYLLAGPLAGALGTVEVMIGGSILAFIAFAVGLAPRQTRMLERLRVAPSGVEPDESLRGLAHRS